MVLVVTSIPKGKQVVTDKDCQYQSVLSLQNHREWLQEGSLFAKFIEGCRTNQTVASNSRESVYDPHKPALASETRQDRKEEQVA